MLHFCPHPVLSVTLSCSTSAIYIWGRYLSVCCPCTVRSLVASLAFTQWMLVASYSPVLRTRNVFRYCQVGITAELLPQEEPKRKAVGEVWRGTRGSALGACARTPLSWFSSGSHQVHTRALGEFLVVRFLRMLLGYQVSGSQRCW